MNEFTAKLVAEIFKGRAIKTMKPVEWMVVLKGEKDGTKYDLLLDSTGFMVTHGPAVLAQNDIDV